MVVRQNQQGHSETTYPRRSQSVDNVALGGVAVDGVVAVLSNSVP